MPSLRTGVVVRLLEARRGLQRVEVDLGDGPERAYALTQLTGGVGLGDRVVVNTTAVELGLGTGGWHVVHWNLAREEWREAGAAPALKARSPHPPGAGAAAGEGGAGPAPWRCVPRGAGGGARGAHPRARGGAGVQGGAA